MRQAVALRLEQVGLSQAARWRLLCLRVLAWLTRPFLFHAAPLFPPRRILLIRPDHLGDVLFTTPALAQLRAALPQAHIAYLCGPWSRDLLVGNPNLDQVLTCDFPWFNRRPKGWPWQPYQSLWQESRRLRREGFDTAIVLRFDFWWGAMLAALAGIPRRIGYDIPECQPFLTQAVPYVQGRHEVEQNLTLLTEEIGKSANRQIGGRAERRLEFYPSVEDEIQVQKLLESRGLLSAANPKSEIQNLKSVIIHPGTGAAVKLWPPERWAAVADALVERWGVRILLTGSAGERGLAEDIAAAMRQPATILAGETNLGQLAALFARCDLVLGVDSGPLHLAVAMDAPTVHLCGPVDPAAFGPWGDPQRHRVVQAHYGEEPCRGRPCNRLDYGPAELAHHPCMATITLDQVLTAADSICRR